MLQRHGVDLISGEMCQQAWTCSPSNRDMVCKDEIDSAPARPSSFCLGALGGL